MFLEVEAFDRSGGDYFGAEALGLGNGPPRQIGARQAGGEAEIVLDARAGACLTAGNTAVQQGHTQPFGCAVHRRRQTGRARPDDHQVVEIAGRTCLQPGPLGHRGGVGSRGAGVVFEYHRGQVFGCKPGTCHDGRGVVVLFDV